MFDKEALMNKKHSVYFNPSAGRGLVLYEDGTAHLLSVNEHVTMNELVLVNNEFELGSWIDHLQCTIPTINIGEFPYKAFQDYMVLHVGTYRLVEWFLHACNKKHPSSLRERAVVLFEKYLGRSTKESVALFHQNLLAVPTSLDFVVETCPFKEDSEGARAFHQMTGR